MMKERPTINSLNDAFDHGCIQSMTRHMPNGYWDEMSYYHVRLSDDTQRDFYEAEDLVCFINHWLDFIFRKEE